MPKKPAQKATKKKGIRTAAEMKRTDTQIKEEKARPVAVTIAPAQETPPKAVKVQEKKQLKWIGPWSYAKISMIGAAIFGLVYGLLLAIIVSIPGFMTKAMADDSATLLSFYKATGWWLVIIMPVIYGILGLLCGALGAAIYNLVAKRVGGIEVVLE